MLDDGQIAISVEGIYHSKLTASPVDDMETLVIGDEVKVAFVDQLERALALVLPHDSVILLHHRHPAYRRSAQRRLGHPGYAGRPQTSRYIE